MKNKIKWKHQIYKTYIKNGHKDSDLSNLKTKQVYIIPALVGRCKKECQNHILNDPKTNAKTYWSVLKTFLQW